MSVKKTFYVGAFLDEDLKPFLEDRKENHRQSYSWIVNKAVRELMNRTKEGAPI